MNFLLKNFKIKIYLFSLMIILSIFTNTFYNIYAISKRPYTERLMINYGFGCEKNSYGFIQEALDKYSQQNSVYIINFKNMPNPKSIFTNINVDFRSQNLILLNFRNNKIELKKLKDLKIYLDQYSLIRNLDNCYLYKKND